MKINDCLDSEGEEEDEEERRRGNEEVGKKE